MIIHTYIILYDESINNIGGAIISIDRKLLILGIALYVYSLLLREKFLEPLYIGPLSIFIET